MKKSLLFSLIVFAVFPYFYVCFNYLTKPISALFGLFPQTLFIWFICLVILAIQYHIYTLNEPDRPSKHRWGVFSLWTCLLFWGVWWVADEYVPAYRFRLTKETALTNLVAKVNRVAGLQTISQHGGCITFLNGTEVNCRAKKGSRLPENTFLNRHGIDSLALSGLVSQMAEQDVFFIRTGKDRTDISFRSGAGTFVCLPEQSTASLEYLRLIHGRWYLALNQD
ncbi:MAG: hypothetical protein J7576_07715 [Siphonobacter aquaeclarae]|nr:hypothetical protein [Siphonobacter aquaeclarae]